MAKVAVMHIRKTFEIFFVRSMNKIINFHNSNIISNADLFFNKKVSGLKITWNVNALIYEARVYRFHKTLK